MRLSGSVLLVTGNTLYFLSSDNLYNSHGKSLCSIRNVTWLFSLSWSRWLHHPLIPLAFQATILRLLTSLSDLFNMITININHTRKAIIMYRLFILLVPRLVVLVKKILYHCHVHHSTSNHYQYFGYFAYCFFDTNLHSDLYCISSLKDIITFIIYFEQTDNFINTCPV